MATLLAAAALLVALATLGATSASAFPQNCTQNPDGTKSCSGTASDSFSASDKNDPLCTPGKHEFFEDSYLPSDAENPTLTHFVVNPNPPCTGASPIGAPTVTWPAPTARPDGQPILPPPDDSIFRMVWSYTVPNNSTAVGDMDVTWSISWTEPEPYGTTDTTGDTGDTGTTGETGETGGGTGDGTTTTVSQTTGNGTGAGRCDWFVAFVNPPATALAGEHVKYRIVVGNTGTATCPESTLALAANSATAVGRDTSLEGDRSVPALPPGAAVTATFVTRRAVRGIDYDAQLAIVSTGLLKVTAAMPADSDGLPSDEFATASTEFSFSGESAGKDAVSRGHPTESFTCGASSNDSCAVAGYVSTEFCTSGPNQVCGNDQPLDCPSASAPDCSTERFMTCTSGFPDTCGAGAHLAAVKMPKSVVIGEVSGSVRGGKRGKITIRLNRAGNALLRRSHPLHERMVLTVTDNAGQRSTIAYPITLNR